MPFVLTRFLQALAIGLGVLTLLSLVPLLVWDALPGLFPPAAHDVLAAFPLAVIAVAYVVDRSLRSASRTQLAKAIMLALAFLFWAANQLWPRHPLATFFNDVAIAAFVLDVFLVLVQRLRPVEPEAFGDSLRRGLPSATAERVLANATEEP